MNKWTAQKVKGLYARAHTRLLLSARRKCPFWFFSRKKQGDITMFHICTASCQPTGQPTDGGNIKDARFPGFLETKKENVVHRGYCNHCEQEP